MNTSSNNNSNIDINDKFPTSEQSGLLNIVSVEEKISKDSRNYKVCKVLYVEVKDTVNPLTGELISAVGATKSGTFIAWDRQPVKAGNTPGSGKLNPEYALYTEGGAVLGAIVTTEVKPYTIVNSDSITETNTASQVVLGDSTSDNWAKTCMRTFKDARNPDGTPRFVLAQTGDVVSKVTKINETV